MRNFLFVALALFGGTYLFGQNVMSARSGMIHYTEGRVLLDGKNVESKFGEFPQVKNGLVLAAEDGRAEVLLTPGVFLRLSENSSFRMVSDALAATQVEIVSGAAILEVDELLEGNAVTVRVGDAQVAVVKKGLYRIDAEPARLRVYEGEARVTANQDKAVVKKGRQLELGAVLSASNFSTKDTDAFYRWSARRAEYIATANFATARSSVINYSRTGNWVWNPWYGMFTYLPGYGFGYSPYGWAWYSPVTVYSVVVTPPQGGGGTPTQITSPIRDSAPSRSSVVGFTTAPRVSLGPSPSIVSSGGMMDSRGASTFGGGGGGGMSAPVSAPSMGSSGGATASHGAAPSSGGGAGRSSQ